jgi:hypothetical protein
MQFRAYPRRTLRCRSISAISAVITDTLAFMRSTRVLRSPTATLIAEMNVGSPVTILSAYENPITNARL